MEALTSFSTTIFTPSRLTQQGRSDFAFSPSPTFKKLNSLNLVSLQSVAKSYVATDASEVSTGLENAVAGSLQIGRSKTAHVKFQLQKECMFGDEFLLVGDDPILGLWNPANAVPMKWSDGNIWSVELDVPIESTIQFKFILKQSTGDMIWQPGPDRIFKSWESKGTVVIAEDWESPEAQKITEELHQGDKLMPNMNNRMMVSGNTAYAEEKLNVSNELFNNESTIHPVEGYEAGGFLVPDLTPP